MRRSYLFFFCSFLFLLIFCVQVTSAERLRLATTTSTESSGLLAYLNPVFERKHGVRVHTIAVGTGRALRLGKNGDVDVVLVHAREAEEAFMNKGYGVNRRRVMHNDFVIVGPPSDPARMKRLRGVSNALEKIRKSGAIWFSRGDDSGTHKKEIILWKAAGLKPDGTHYRSLGQGMGQTLIVADEKRGYTITDRGTYLSFSTKGIISLRIYVEGDKELFNPYGVIVVNPKRHPHVNYELAKKYAAFLISFEGQRLIANFRLDGKQLFYPAAEGSLKD